MKTKLLAFPLLMMAPGLAGTALANPLRIIHTNDLHSHLDHATDPGLGGYAGVKTVIDRLKAEAIAAGEDTLVLDAGDFTEGSQFFLADRGRTVWQAMSAMGYDAVALGNHDWFVGLPELDRLIGEAPPAFQLLCANLEHSASLPHLEGGMHESAEFKRAGARIAVLGLSTDEKQYAWMLGDGQMASPVRVARELVPELRQRNDFVIALTHIGLSHDRKLAREVPGIDLIVGGHSHTYLFEAAYEGTGSDRPVPIVQTGQHGEYVGSLDVDVEPGKPLTVLRYRLIPVTAADRTDAAVNALVDRARAALDERYGHDWLHETIGYAETPLLNPFQAHHQTAWSKFIASAMMEAAGTDAAIDAAEFDGISQPTGPITREQLFALYPRILDLADGRGWHVWTIEMEGWALKLAVEQAIGRGSVLNLAGLTYETSRKHNGGVSIHGLKIGGKPVEDLRFYKLGVPEGIVKGGFGITTVLKAVLRKPVDTGIPIWMAAEQKLREQHVIKAD